MKTTYLQFASKAAAGLLLLGAAFTQVQAESPAAQPASPPPPTANTSPASAPPPTASTFTEAFTKGKGQIKFRYRLESVDQENFDENALASTLRSRLNFRTADLYGFGAFLEVDWIAKIFADHYDQGGGNTPDKNKYPVVADVTGAFLNQAWLQWANPKGTLVRGGQQVILYDNQRFVGNVGWRQHEQTFDAGYFQQKTASGFDFQAAYVWQVNRIYGNDVPAGTNDNQTWLLNGAKDWKNVGKLTAYYYNIDNEDVASYSTISYGSRWAGLHKFTSLTLGYALEYAHQKGAHNNPVDYGADYYHINVSLAWPKVTPSIGFESLGGDNTRAGAAFRTPLATLHAFNGWADLFLVTPNAGLNDLYGGLKGPIGTWTWELVYHDFQAESGPAKWGDELDAGIATKFADHYSVYFKLGTFNSSSGSPYPDTTKFWVQLTADF